MTINDICMHAQDRLMGQQEIEETYHMNTNFLKNLSLRNSIPFEWRQTLTRDFAVDQRIKYEISVQGETLDILNSSPKKWYAMIVRGKRQENKRKESWRQDLVHTQVGQLRIDWENTFSTPYYTTRETKLHSFQYRIFYKLITCNKYLHKIHLQTDSHCSFCPEEDNILQFLVECPPVRKFWNDLDESWM